MYDGNARREGWAVEKAGESLRSIARASEEFSALGIVESEGPGVVDALWYAANYLVRIYSHLSLPDIKLTIPQFKRWTDFIIEDGSNGYRIFVNEIEALKKQEGEKNG